MKIHLVENSYSFIAGITSISKYKIINTITDSNNINEICCKIATNISEDDILFINCEISILSKRRQELFGIQVLKRLRLKGINNHCVLYSFLSREQIMLLSTENLIIFSKGITFIQLPSDFSNIEVDKLVQKKAPKDLSEYFKAESRLPDNRHFFANWWGVRQLWSTYKKWENLDEDNSTDLEEKIFRNAKDIDSYQGLLAQYLYHKEYKSTKEIIEEKLALISLRESINNDENDRRLKEVEEKNELIIRLERLNKELDALKRGGVISKFFNKKKYVLLDDQITFLSNQIKSIDVQIDSPQVESSDELNETCIKNNINTNTDENINYRNIDNQFNNFINELHTKPPKILYIDDQANEGWSDIFQLMIYNTIDEKNPFEIYAPEKETDDHLLNDCLTKSKENFDLIILDLRLQGEEGPINDLSEISGIKVLKALKNGYNENKSVSCPILVVTASNKSRVLQIINNLGADAYWIKEGLDSNFSEDESIDNFIDFIAKVYILTKSPINLLLKSMKDQSNKFHNKIYWWNDQNRFKNNCPNVVFNEIKTDSFVNILKECVSLLETILRDNLSKSYSLTISDSIASLITVRLFKIIEDIHKEENMDPTIYVALSKLVDDHHRGQAITTITRILMIRNQSAHSNSTDVIMLKEFFDHLINFLSKIPTPVQEFKIVGSIKLDERDRRMF